MLILFRIITGLGVGGEWATGQTYICETFPSKMRGRFGAFMQTGALLGVALASIIGGFITPLIGWRSSFFISILPALLVIIIRKSLSESDVWLERKKVLAVQSAPETLSTFTTLFSKLYRKLFSYL
jgi:MFS family permease